jgi:hypothetical protein
VSNLSLWEANCRIEDADTYAKSNAFNIGLSNLRVINIARVERTHTKCSAVSFSNWQDAQTCCQSQSHRFLHEISKTVDRNLKNYFQLTILQESLQKKVIGPNLKKLFRS